jgi:transcriptional regulator with XRE-family HTH domain
MSRTKEEKTGKSNVLKEKGHLFQKVITHPDLVGADVANQFQRNRIGDLIAKKFAARNYEPSDEQLDKLGITRRMFTLIRENKSEPGFGTALRIATWLDVSVDELYLV